MNIDLSSIKHKQMGDKTIKGLAVSAKTNPIAAVALAKYKKLVPMQQYAQSGLLVLGRPSLLKGLTIAEAGLTGVSKSTFEGSSSGGLAGAITKTVKSVSKVTKKAVNGVEGVAKTATTATVQLAKGDIKGSVKSLGQSVAHALTVAQAPTSGATFQKLQNSERLNKWTLNIGKMATRHEQGTQHWAKTGVITKQFVQSTAQLVATIGTIGAGAALAAANGGAGTLAAQGATAAGKAAAGAAVKAGTAVAAGKVAQAIKPKQKAQSAPTQSGSNKNMLIYSAAAIGLIFLVKR